MPPKQPRKSVNREPWLATTLSMIFPGLGQFYAQNYLKGVFFLLSHFLLSCASLFFFISRSGNLVIGLSLIGFLLLLTFISFVDAYQSVKKQNSPAFESKRRQNKDPWFAVFLSRFMLGVGHFYLNKWGMGIGLFIFTLLAITIPFIGIIGLLVTPFILYHVYQAAPLRRESSNKAILGVALYGGLIAPLISMLIAISTRYFIAEARYIPGGSMEPTLLLNDRLIINKVSHRFQDPQRGDIIVFNPNQALRDLGLDQAFIKRIIGLPGDRIEIKEGSVYINKQPLVEPYLAAPKSTEIDVCGGIEIETPLKQAITLPQDSYIVMGDNRQNSLDSRCWGLVARADIVGVATQRFWPLTRMGLIYSRK